MTKKGFLGNGAGTCLSMPQFMEVFMYKVGFAEKVITPDVDVWLCGYAARYKPSNGVHDDLYVKALYICDEHGTEVVALTFDIAGVDHTIVAELKEKILARYGIQNVIVNATHNHSGPAISYFVVSEPEHVNEEWARFAKKTAVDAVAEAIDAAEPVNLYVAACSAPEMTRNRRPNETIADSALTILRAENEKGEVKGFIINYACHCTILDGNNYLITADYPGFLYKKLREKYKNSITIFFNGACGNLNIGYSADASALGIDMGDMRTFENAERKADYLIRCGEEGLENSIAVEGELKYFSKKLEFPIKEGIPTKEQLEERIADYDKKIEMCKDEKTRKELQILQIYDISLLRNIKNYVDKDKGYIPAETVLFKLGNVWKIFVCYRG
jgi:neutral ceramidase